MKSMCNNVLKLNVLWVGEGLWEVPSSSPYGDKKFTYKKKA